MSKIAASQLLDADVIFAPPSERAFIRHGSFPHGRMMRTTALVRRTMPALAASVADIERVASRASISGSKGTSAAIATPWRGQSMHRH